MTPTVDQAVAQAVSWESGLIQQPGQREFDVRFSDDPNHVWRFTEEEIKDANPRLCRFLTNRLFVGTSSEVRSGKKLNLRELNGVAVRWTVRLWAQRQLVLCQDQHIHDAEPGTDGSVLVGAVHAITPHADSGVTFLTCDVGVVQTVRGIGPHVQSVVHEIPVGVHTAWFEERFPAASEKLDAGLALGLKGDALLDYALPMCPVVHEVLAVAMPSHGLSPGGVL